jgi:hypothetical protein
MTNKTATPRKAKPKEKLLRLLRGGAEGVRQWNAQIAKKREKLGAFSAVDLARTELSAVDLGSLHFPDARFDDATLIEAWLMECHLEQASFQRAKLDRSWCAGAYLLAADFEGASLRQCNLRDCDLRKARFANSNLEAATLDGADLRGADLTSANLRGASFRGARYDKDTRWPRGVGAPDGATWVGVGSPPLDFDVFLKRLQGLVDLRRLGRALEMLKAERFQLFSQFDGNSLIGIVKSQTDPRTVYSCRLDVDGGFACCSQDLALCLGLRGALCKHLLVLLVGLVKAGEVDVATVQAWVRASHDHKPKLDAEGMAEILLRYKAAEAGEIDWRPTETIPEDYYAL